MPTAKADLTLSCVPGVTAEIWFGAGIIVWHVPAGPQVWRLGAVTPTTIPFQRVIETYPVGAGLVYVVVYADIDRLTGRSTTGSKIRPLATPPAPARRRSPGRRPP
jgi:hypothetical protein